MARSAMTIRTRPVATLAAGGYAFIAAMDVFDFTNGMYCPINGQIGFEFKNPTAGIVTLTCTSQPDELNRTQDLVLAIPVGDSVILPEFPRNGWADPASATGDQMYFSASATGLTYFAIQRAPGT